MQACYDSNGSRCELMVRDSHTLDDLERYRRLIEKLIYFIVIKSDITFIVGVLSRFMHQARENHWLAEIRVLAYINSCPRKGLVYRNHGHVRIFGYSDSGYAGDRGDESLLLGITPLLEEFGDLKE